MPSIGEGLNSWIDAGISFTWFTRGLGCWHLIDTRLAHLDRHDKHFVEFDTIVVSTKHLPPPHSLSGISHTKTIGSYYMFMFMKYSYLIVMLTGTVKVIRNP